MRGGEFYFFGTWLILNFMGIDESLVERVKDYIIIFD